MTRATLEKSLSNALRKTLTENRDSLRDLLAEVIEDVALANAIRHGESSKRVKRELVIKALSRTK